jgi:hypothetical protein
MFAKAYMGRKRRAQPSSASVTWAKTANKGKKSSCNGVKAFEKSVFGPCTLRRTWGTRPEKRASFFAEDQPPYGTDPEMAVLTLTLKPLRYVFRTMIVTATISKD